MAMSPNTVTTGKVRLSYCHLNQPEQGVNGGGPKYSVTALIPKTDTATVNACYAAIEAAKAIGLSGNWGGVAPVSIDIPLRDGDGIQPKKQEPYSKECHGHFVLKCRTTNKPYVVDGNIQPIIDPNAVYSGCYGRISVSFAPYNNAGGKGITCILNGVQFICDGEPFGGGISAEEAFGNPQPGYPQQPPAAYGYGYPQQPPAAPAYGYAPQQPPVPGFNVMGM